MDAFIGIVCLLTLVTSLVFAGSRYTERSYNNLTGMSYSEIEELKHVCESPLKRTENCKIIYVKSDSGDANE